MKALHTVRRWLALTLLISSASLTGCGPNPAAVTHPDRVAEDQGIVFGRVHVYRGDSDVTGSCKVEFQDEKEVLTGTYSLDKDGWIFAALPKKRNYLYFVRCAVMFGLFYGTRDLYFDIPQTSENTYLGDIEFWTDHAKLDEVPGVKGSPTLEGGLIELSSKVPAVIKSDDDAIIVRYKLDEAAREYKSRFGTAP